MGNSEWSGDRACALTAELEGEYSIAMRFLRWSSVVVVFLISGALVTYADDGPPKKPASAPASLYAMTPAQFATSERAKESLDMEHVDADLMSAAIFHETNKRRAENHLPALRHLAKLDAAAAMHAKDMAEGGWLEHENPNDTKKRTPRDRVKLAGLDPSFIAENIATEFAIKYESGKPYYPMGNGNASSTPNGPAIPHHTYVSFAKALLDDWMNSPGHRQNILSSEAKSLGTAAYPAKAKDDEIPQFYAAQEFSAP